MQYGCETEAGFDVSVLATIIISATSSSSSPVSSGISPTQSDSLTASISTASSNLMSTGTTASITSYTAVAASATSFSAGAIAGVVVGSIAGLAVIFCIVFLLIRIHRMQKRQLAETNRLSSHPYPYQNRYVNPQEPETETSEVMASAAWPQSHPDSSDQNSMAWASPTGVASPSSWLPPSALLSPSNHGDRNRRSFSSFTEAGGVPFSPESLSNSPGQGSSKSGHGNIGPAELSVTDSGCVGPAELPGEDVRKAA